MSSALAPAAPPDSNPAETTPSPEKSASSPGNDEIASPPAPIGTVQVPLPSLSPPHSDISPAPLLAAPPVLPVVTGTGTGTGTGTTPPSVSPALPSPSLPQFQPQPQPPVVLPTPVTKEIPPTKTTPTPNISPPTEKPVTIVTQTPTRSFSKSNPTAPTLSPPLRTSPLPPVRQSKTGPIPTKPDPLKPVPSSSPPLPASQLPSVLQPKTRPATARPGLPTGKSIHAPKHSPVAASAVLPSQPPVALPVPQAPKGGAWFPSTTTLSPSILPSIPGTRTPAGVNSPVFDGSNNNGSSSSSAPLNASMSSSGGSNLLVVGVVIGGVFLLVLGAVFGIVVIFCRKRQKKVESHGSEKLHASSFKGFNDKNSLPLYTKLAANTPGAQLAVDGHSSTSGSTTHFSSGTFTYDELEAATNGFSDQNLLGQGGFGYVHKGVLPNGKEVAVKQLKMGGDQGEREFQAEVDTISQVHHKHLVSLVGYCISGPERLLVYEFVDNNTLDFHLHGKGRPVMDWPTRLKIAIGSAKGLAYLHEDCSPSIIHRDIKAANILLDVNFEAKVSDFGLAKIFSSTNPSVTHMTTRVVGTFGYLAPEYASSGKVTDKSDVYSYGVVLLELITGNPPISDFGPATNGGLVNWARPLLAQSIADGNFDTLVDSRLLNKYNVDEMTSMVSCAAACVRLSSWRRPRMSQVIRALEGNLSASELDGGTMPGMSSMHFPYDSLNFDARNYIEDMKRMALANSRYSDNTSDYGLDPSTSSSDTSQGSTYASRIV